MKATPAEEMTGHEQVDRPSGVKSISEPQRKRMYAIWKRAGWTDDEVKNLLAEKYGFISAKDVTTGKYQEICQKLEAGTQPEPGTEG